MHFLYVKYLKEMIFIVFIFKIIQFYIIYWTIETI